MISASSKCGRLAWLLLCVVPIAADECALRKDCASCQDLSPACSWCSTSGVCVPAPEPTRDFLRVAFTFGNARFFALLTYSTAEFQASFPDGFRTRQHFLFVNDTSCGLWLNGRSSCDLDKPSILPMWSPCTGKSSLSECLQVNHEHGGCGYCLGPDGGCLPGTLSGKALYGPRSQSPSCAAPDSEEPFREEQGSNAEGVWLFTGGRPPEVPMFQTCKEAQARYVSYEGRLVMGNADYGVSYGQSLQCSWEIWPRGQVAEGKLSLKLNVSSLRYDGDFLEIIRLDLNGTTVPGASMLARGPALLSSDVDGPVRVQFRSFTGDASRENEMDLGVWSMDWSYEAPVVTTTRFSYPPPPPTNPESDIELARNIMITTLSVAFALLVICSLLYIWRAYIYIVRDPADPCAAQVVPGLDLNGLEERHPSCKPQVLGVPMTVHLACSVCLNNFQPGDVYRKLPCNHYFHQDCIDYWLNRAKSCPTCRSNILDMEDNAERGREPDVEDPADCPAEQGPVPPEEDRPVVAERTNSPDLRVEEAHTVADSQPVRELVMEI